ncbi:sugar ABC transporter ATP-binding protein [Actinomycetes bacterium]|nr:sugar ABC transporter ATP-binding protein [Actinomycetes bacterium]
MNENSLLRATNLSKNFGSVSVLKSINLHVIPNESVGLIGDNGAGKSTLVKILAGVYSPSGGELFFNGSAVTFRNPLDARSAGIEIIYQDLALCDDLDAASNIFLGRESMKRIGPGRWLDRNGMMQEARNALAELGADIAPDQLVASMSGGQRQLVSVARALQFAPKLLLMDEPTASLSSTKIHLLLNLVKNLKKKGVSVILISHRFTDLLSVCDRIIAMRDGCISAEIRPTESKTSDLIERMQLALSGESRL